LTEALLEYAQHEFELGKRQKDGASLREHLESVHRQTGRMPDQLEPVEIPYYIKYIWEWFCSMSNGRGYAEWGAMPLTYSEIKAWAELTKCEPMAWEVEILKKIDNIFVSKAGEK